jgi:hypothetical protein
MILVEGVTMSDLLLLNVDGQDVYVQVERSYGSEPTAAPGQPVVRVEKAFEQAKASVVAVTRSMLRTLNDEEQKLQPNVVELELGVKFSAEGHAVLVSGGAEATLKITLTYNLK